MHRFFSDIKMLDGQISKRKNSDEYHNCYKTDKKDKARLHPHHKNESI